MVQRRKIGLIYVYNENWIGGTYYIQNIILSLHTLADNEKPEIVVFTSNKEDFEKLIKGMSYPFLENRSISYSKSLFKRVVYKISKLLFKKNLLFEKLHKDLDFVFPFSDYHVFKDIPEEKKYFWIPDFQQKHLPHFFSDSTLAFRETLVQKIMNKKEARLIFSSQDAKQDLSFFYGKPSIKTSVLPFAITKNKTQNIAQKEIDQVLNKYGVEDGFFFVPNQLWIHKNHMLVIKAVKELKSQGKSVLVLCSGKKEEPRKPNHPDELQKIIDEFGLNDYIKLLGFISKSEVDVLFNSCTAIIQPSLFEGWNTGIEEAKHGNKFILASSIGVHKEQLSSYSSKAFFDTDKVETLVNLLSEEKSFFQVRAVYNYSDDIKQFAERFVSL